MTREMRDFLRQSGWQMPCLFMRHDPATQESTRNRAWASRQLERRTCAGAETQPQTAARDRASGGPCALERILKIESSRRGVTRQRHAPIVDVAIESSPALV
jgi:hypothetical protein